MLLPRARHVHKRLNPLGFSIALLQVFCFVVFFCFGPVVAPFLDGNICSMPMLRVCDLSFDLTRIHSQLSLRRNSGL